MARHTEAAAAASKPAPSSAASSKAASSAKGAKDRTRRLMAFVTERHPFVVETIAAALTNDKDGIDAHEKRVAAAVDALRVNDGDVAETTPFVTASTRFQHAKDELARDVAGFFFRERVKESITDDEKRWMLRGLTLTRTTDNRLKQMFLSSELKYGDVGFQGKGFRSLGQEAVFALALRLKRGDAHRTDDGWRGDVVAPLIRDLGVMLAFTDDPSLALNAQAGKIGPPMGGRDLHYGDIDQGVLWAAAPLTIATTVVTGVALAMRENKEERVCVSFIGDGGSSLGEWHESINMAAVMGLPMVFVVENNQTALSTKVSEQSRARVFAEKATGYGIPTLTLDGNDPVEVAAAGAWAADHARRGLGPVLLELVSMRMCGHAHHDDMLYLGGDPNLTLELPPIPEKGYVDVEKYRQWTMRDPLARFAATLIASGVVSGDDVKTMFTDTKTRVDDVMDEIKTRAWPDPSTVGHDVTALGPVPVQDAGVAIPSFGSVDDSVGDDDGSNFDGDRARDVVEDAPAFHPKGSTMLDAIGLGVVDVFEENPRAFVLGEDVGPPYGNAFLLLKPVVDKYPTRVMNTPIAEGAILGAAHGAALAGMTPIAEIQFNDFVASGFNQVVNAIAKFRYRTGKGLNLVVRLPFGGLRRAGPYHSQDTSPWFYRTPGLVIVCPSTPHDARGLLVSAARASDPVLFYEHIALYRAPHIKQTLADDVVPIPLGKAALRRRGDDLSVITYGAYVWKAMAAAKTLADEHGIECDVLDLRTLSPLDKRAIAATVKRTGRVLLVGEDTKTGSILESIASKISESLFDVLDGPVRVLGALDTPVPYAPSLEDAFLISERMITDTAVAMLQW